MARYEVSWTVSPAHAREGQAALVIWQDKPRSDAGLPDGEPDIVISLNPAAIRALCEAGLLYADYLLHPEGYVIGGDAPPLTHETVHSILTERAHEHPHPDRDTIRRLFGGG